ncbi:DUF565 domain-containing protein [Synechococcus sp. CS-205]|uniref:DUF565 domain-containing protein n=1 Tax=Synechococcus sp. CS-205 TaxID=2847984 RepID=UPI00223B6CF9|nr:DUF565 domain-containing protein [Synechococcus sp. CS-205]MCT0249700.1 DUF565 domain-containing protein [Synechococcus sp. CS-205]
MSPLPVQSTRLEQALESSARTAWSGWRGSWRHRSLSLLALLLGLFAGNNVTAFVSYLVGPRPLVVLLLVVLVELLVRLRSHWVRGEPSLGWRLCDNLRIGVVYAVVLEGFKLGS